MDYQNQHQYDDILNLPHPTSKNHPRMSLHDRAAQFSPFAALTGHEAAIKETARLTDDKQILSEDVIEKINGQLKIIAENIGAEQEITVTYFMPDSKKSGGAYVDCAGTVRKIDKYNRTLVMTVRLIWGICMRITSMASVKLQKSIWILSRSTKRYSTGTGKEK